MLLTRCFFVFWDGAADSALKSWTITDENLLS